jgi:hypothetical protein
MGLTEEDDLKVATCEDAVNKLQKGMSQMQLHKASLVVILYS